MKGTIKATAVFALLIAAVPMISVFAGSGRRGAENAPDHRESSETAAVPEREEDALTAVPYRVSGGRDFPVYIVSEGRTVHISERDYVIGAVFAEMPASYPEEALKAQAAAARTYILRRKMSEPPYPGGAYITDDSTRYEPFLFPEQARALCGDDYDECLEKVSAAADSVMDIAVVYRGEPVVAAFHPVSAGRTESGANVWGTEIPYLIPADSPYDTEAPDNTQERSFTDDELYARFSQQYDLPFDIEDIVPEITSVSASGTVLSADVSGSTFTGAEIAELLSLPSANFTVAQNGGKNVFTVKGVGHGAGMSQYGAMRMAEEGCTYDEILRHYYRGIDIVPVIYEDE